MKLEATEVDRIAALANLELTPPERERFASELSVVLTYAFAIDSYDTGDEAPPPALAEHALLRDDRSQCTLDRESVAASAPRFEDGFFVVPPVLGGA